MPRKDRSPVRSKALSIISPPAIRPQFRLLSAKGRASRLTSVFREENMPNTIRLHRVFATRPEKLYRAFLEPDAVASWLPPFGFVCTVHELDAKEGGKHRMSFRNFTNGRSHAFGGTYLELVPDKRIVYSDSFEDSNLPGEMKTTIVLKAVSVGTEVNIEQAGVPDVIPAEACYLGWQESLRKLAKLVEPEINE